MDFCSMAFTKHWQLQLVKNGMHRTIQTHIGRLLQFGDGCTILGSQDSPLLWFVGSYQRWLTRISAYSGEGNMLPAPATTLIVLQ
jgi:hypothetical protein